MIAIGAITFSASAQTQKSDDINQAEERAERKAQQSIRINPRLLEQLELTGTQKEQIKFINAEYRAKMQEMIKSEIPAEERKAKRTAFEIEKRNKILTVLTPEQEKKLKELQSKEIDNRNNKGEYKEKIKIDGEETKIKIKKD